MSGMFQGTFAAFRFYDDSAGEATSNALAAQDTNHSFNNDSNVAIQVRVRIDETGGLDGTTMDDFELFYSKNSGTFVALTTTDNGDGIRAVAAGLTNNAATTDRSSEPIGNPGGGSFVAGEQSDDGIVDDLQITSSNFTELAFGVEFVTANTSNDDTFDFELQGKVDINSVVPRITIIKTGPDQTADGAPSVTKFTATGSAIGPPASFGSIVKSDQHITSTANATGDLGSNPLSGNLLVVTYAVPNSARVLDTPPSGFAALHESSDGTGGNWYSFWKISDGTEQTVVGVFDAADDIGVLYVEYVWGEGTPDVTTNEDVTNISTAVTTQASGALTPGTSNNIMLAGHGIDNSNNGFTGQAVDGAWIEDFLFLDEVGSMFKLSRLVDVSGSQEATHTSTDTADQMYGTIVSFDVAEVGPTIVSITESHVVDGSTLVVDNPASGIVSGDLLLHIACNDGTGDTISYPAGALTDNELANANPGSFGILITYEIADGSENGGSNTLTLSAGVENINAFVLHIQNWHGTTPPELVRVASNGSNPDPPSLNPAGWGTEKTLWIAGQLQDQDANTVSVYPYPDNQTLTANANSQIAFCSDVLETASQDPGAFTLSISTDREAFTIAIRPAGTDKLADGSPSITPVESSGSARQERSASGSPSTTKITSAGTASQPGGDQNATGSPSINKVVAAAVARVLRKARSGPTIFDELIGYGSKATGGKDGTVVTVTNTNDTGSGSLRQAVIDASGATWIVFTPGLTGTITFASFLDLKADMTIDGRGADITIDAERIRGTVNDVNIILLYLKHTGTSGAGQDCWQADMDGAAGNGNWWVHHCTFQDAFDELIGITNAVSDWTISYSKLESLSGAGKAMLAGGSNGDPTTMWGTMHHNWINALERLPRTRRVKLHYYNNFIEGWTSDNPAVNIGDNGQCLFEKCVADANGTGTVALDQQADPTPGLTKSIGPHHLLNGATVVENTPGGVFDPTTDGPTGIPGYNYTAEDADADLKALLEAEAGWQNVPHPGTVAPWDAPGLKISAVTSVGSAFVGLFANGSPSIANVTAAGVAEAIRTADGSPSVTKFTSTGAAVGPGQASPVITPTSVTTVDVATLANATIADVSLSASGNDRILVIANLIKDNTATPAVVSSITVDAAGVNRTIGAGVVLQGSRQLAQEGNFSNQVEIYFVLESDLPSGAGDIDIDIVMDSEVDNNMWIVFEVTGCPEQAYDAIVQNIDLGDVAADVSFSDSITPTVDNCLIVDFWGLSHSAAPVYTTTETQIAVIDANANGSCVASQFTQGTAAAKSMQQELDTLSQRRAWTLLSFAPESGDKTASGSPSITSIEASGSAEAIRTADGGPSITPVESSGSARQERSASGSPSITPVEAAGVAERIETASGSPSITTVEATGVAERIETADGAPSITPVKATGAAERELTSSGSPEIAPVIAIGSAERELTSDGSTSITSVESTGVARTFIDSEGSPSIAPVEASGAAELLRTADGSASTAPVESSGAAEREITSDGSPSITPIESSGSARQERSSSGSPSTTKITAAGSAERELTSDGSPSISNVESAGTAEINPGEADQTANGSPSITPITSSGSARQERSANGSPSITPVEASGAAERELTSDGSPSITPVEAVGTAGREITSDGSPSITSVESTGSAERELTADGSPEITPIISTGAAEREITSDGSPSTTPVESTGVAASKKTADGSPQISAVVSTGDATVHRTADGSPSINNVISGGQGVRTSVKITDVNGTESWIDGDTGLVITGTGFV